MYKFAREATVVPNECSCYALQPMPNFTFNPLQMKPQNTCQHLVVNGRTCIDGVRRPYVDVSARVNNKVIVILHFNEVRSEACSKNGQAVAKSTAV